MYVSVQLCWTIFGTRNRIIGTAPKILERS